MGLLSSDGAKFGRVARFAAVIIAAMIAAAIAASLGDRVGKVKPSPADIARTQKFA